MLKVRASRTVFQSVFATVVIDALMFQQLFPPTWFLKGHHFSTFKLRPSYSNWFWGHKQPGAFFSFIHTVIMGSARCLSCAGTALWRKMWPNESSKAVIYHHAKYWNQNVSLSFAVLAWDFWAFVWSVVWSLSLSIVPRRWAASWNFSVWGVFPLNFPPIWVLKGSAGRVVGIDQQIHHRPFVILTNTKMEVLPL